MEERKGYHFAGWYIDKECTKRINPGGILPHTMSLYDKWIPIWYPVVYQTDGGMNSRKNPKYITIESGVIRLYPAKKQGKIFEGWYLDGKRVEYIPERQCQPVTLVAKYRDFNTVQFETFGGAIIPNMQTNSDKKLEDIRTPMRLGYTFMGWYWDPDYHWQYTYDQTIEEDCTLYARWEVTHFSIIYDVGKGYASRSNPRTYTYFDKTIKLKPAKKEGYRFVGWFDERGNELIEIREHSLGDKQLIAHFEKMD